MAKFVARITAVSLEDGQAQTVFDGGKTKRKVSRWLRPMEKGHRRWLEALASFGADLQDRHERSNRKRKNGWLRDATVNVMHAQRKATKKLFNL
jgi:hypothetical protein